MVWNNMYHIVILYRLPPPSPQCYDTTGIIISAYTHLHASSSLASTGYLIVHRVDYFKVSSKGKHWLEEAMLWNYRYHTVIPYPPPCIQFIGVYEVFNCTQWTTARSTACIDWRRQCYETKCITLSFHTHLHASKSLASTRYLTVWSQPHAHLYASSPHVIYISTSNVMKLHVFHLSVHTHFMHPVHLRLRGS
jgi:hypothetical protein